MIDKSEVVGSCYMTQMVYNLDLYWCDVEGSQMKEGTKDLKCSPNGKIKLCTKFCWDDL
jgi:hypothetical protein